jgi:hypothetical protein
MVDHTYASADEFRNYLAGTSYSSGWTSDAATLLNLLESASRRMDAFVNDNSWGVVTETRLYDLGSGDLVQDPRSKTVDSGGIITTRSRIAAVPLDKWLISATTVTSYEDTARTSSETLTEGIANDYLLRPYNSSPKFEITLTEETTKSFGAGQQVLSIAGKWGWNEDTSPDTTTLNGAISSTSATSVVLTSATNFSVGNTILIGTEQMYIRVISSNTLTVTRGVNGTTAATHSDSATVSRYVYPSLVRETYLDVARVLWRDHDLGNVDSLSVGDQDVRVRSSVEIKDAIKALDVYRVHQASAGVIF